MIGPTANAPEGAPAPVVEVAPWRPFSAGRDLPWLRIGRAPTLAMDGRKLILSACGMIAAQSGWSLLEGFFATSRYRSPLVIRGFPQGPLSDGGLPRLAELVAEPYLGPVSPLLAIFRLGGGASTFAHVLLATLWALLIWGVFGGAIARIAVVQVATGDRVGVATAFRFAARRVVAIVGAPLMVLAGLGFFAALCALPGLLYRIPGSVGPTIAGALAFGPLIAGLVMALIVVGLVAGWPFMVATVAAEAEDAFDAVSRSFSYVFQRPLKLALAVAGLWLLGMLGLAFATAFAGLVLRLTAWGLAFGGPDEAIAALFSVDAPARAVRADGAMIHAGWVRLVGLIASGYAYSYFWSATSILYLLLRLDVDGTEVEDVAMPDREPDAFLPDEPPAAAPVSGPPPAAE